MSSSGRVKSQKAAGDAPAADPKKAPQKPQEGAEEAAEDQEADEAPEAEEELEEADSGSEEDAEEGDAEEDPESDENEPVTGLSQQEIAAGMRKAQRQRKARTPPPIPDGHEAVLTAPQPFGIWIAGKLHRFQKGRTALTEEQHEACHLDDYVRDNGASVSYRPVKKKSAK